MMMMKTYEDNDDDDDGGGGGGDDDDDGAGAGAGAAGAGAAAAAGGGGGAGAGGGGGEDEKTWRTMVCRWYQIAISVCRLDLRIQVGKLCEAADWSCLSLHILGDLAMFSHKPSQ